MPRRENVEPRELEPELAKALKNVGKKQYAHATAREFAKGGKYNPTKAKARYAKS